MSKVDIKFMDENKDVRVCRTPLFFENKGYLYVVLSASDGVLSVVNLTTGRYFDNGFYSDWDEFYETHTETNFKDVEIIATPMLPCK